MVCGGGRRERVWWIVHEREEGEKMRDKGKEASEAPVCESWGKGNPEWRIPCKEQLVLCKRYHL